MRHKFLLFLIMILFSIYNAAASSIGVSPPSESIVYTGQSRIEGKFIVIAGEQKNIHVFTSRGLLKDNIHFDGNETELRFNAAGQREVLYSIELPDSIKPGEYEHILVAKQYLTPEEKVEMGGFARAFPAIGYILTIRVPNEGKFLEAEMEIIPKEISIGDVVYPTIKLLNFGTEDLTGLSTEIAIRDSKEIVSRRKTNTVKLLKPGQKSELRAFWESEGHSPGVYSAEAEINYGGEYTAQAKKSFRLGDIFIEIINVTTQLNESIGKIFIDVQSNWNDEIQDVYAEVVIKQNGSEIESIRTSSVNLGPWGRGRLTAFWEKGSLPGGEYDLEIYVYYYDKEARKHVQVRLSELEKPSPAEESPLLVIAVILLAFILIVNVLILMRSISSKKRQEKEKKK
ncbi:hypothetical protein GF323_00775 [Candidatus Woesearchaeota archaeon]|nr:hypothetical protein [Candidatus Woesearchaeota archaeon]